MASPSSILADEVAALALDLRDRLLAEEDRERRVVARPDDVRRLEVRLPEGVGRARALGGRKSLHGGAVRRGEIAACEREAAQVPEDGGAQHRVAVGAALEPLAGLGAARRHGVGALELERAELVHRAQHRGVRVGHAGVQEARRLVEFGARLGTPESRGEARVVEQESCAHEPERRVGACELEARGERALGGGGIAERHLELAPVLEVVEAPLALNVGGVGGDDRLDPLEPAQRLRERAELALGVAEDLEDRHEARGGGSERALAEGESARRDVAGLLWTPALIEQARELRERDEVMALQRALGPLGERERLADGLLRSLVLIEPLEDATEERIAGNELRALAELALDGEERLGVLPRELEALLPEGEVGEGVLGGGAGFAHGLVVLDQDRLGAGEGPLAGGEVALHDLDLGEAHQDLLELDLLLAGDPLAHLERFLPLGGRLGELALAEVDPGIGDVDVAERFAVLAVAAREDRPGVLEERQRLVVLVHVRDQRCRERGDPPRGLGGLIAVLARRTRRRVAEEREGGRRVGLVDGLDLPLERRNGRRGVGGRRHRGARGRQRDGGRRQCRDRGEECEAEGLADSREGAAHHGCEGSRISMTSTPSAGTGIRCRSSTARAAAVTGVGRSASRPAAPRRS